VQKSAKSDRLWNQYDITSIERIWFVQREPLTTWSTMAPTSSIRREETPAVSETEDIRLKGARAFGVGLLPLREGG